MYLELVTPDKKVFEGEINSVKMPGSQGGFEVLDHHASLISSLGNGQVVIRANNGQEFTIDGGVAEVKDNKVIILAETLIEK